MDYGPIWQLLYGAGASKDNQPENMQAITDWLAQVFGANTTTTTNRKGKETVTTVPNQPNEYNMAVAQGPTGYTEAMRANLGFAPKWQAPTPTPATGMAASASQPSWAGPTAPKTAPTLEQALGVYVAPPPPPMPAPTPPAATPPPQDNGNRPRDGLHPFGAILGDRSVGNSNPLANFDGSKSRGSVFDVYQRGGHR